MIETVGSSAWLRRVFEEEARDDLFAGHAPQEQPVLVLLGGQPAAGKTRAPFEMPAATAPVSGGLVKLALDHALERRYSVLLEGTFRDPGMVTGTATRFAEAGYRVEVVAVATPAPVSRLSAEMRSLGDGPNEPGRWTPPEAHETALAGSAGVLSALEALPHIARVRVFSREAQLFDNQRDAAGEWEREPAAAHTPPARAAAPAATRHGRSVVEGLLIRLRASETQTGLPRRADCPDVCSPARRCGADAPYPLRPGDGTGVPAPRASAPPARSGTSPPFRHVPAEATPRPRTTDYGRASRCRPARPEPRQMRERARSRSTCESLLFAAQTYRLRPGPGR